MPVRSLEDPHRRKVEAVVDDLAELAHTEGALSILFIVEMPGRKNPIVGIAGRLRSDPHRAIGQLSVVQQRLVKLAAHHDGFADSTF